MNDWGIWLGFDGILKTEADEKDPLPPPSGRVKGLEWAGLLQFEQFGPGHAGLTRIGITLDHLLED